MVSKTVRCRFDHLKMVAGIDVCMWCGAAVVLILLLSLTLYIFDDFIYICSCVYNFCVPISGTEREFELKTQKNNR